MSTALKELNQLKFKYYGEFSFDSIPRYFSPVVTPRAHGTYHSLNVSWEKSWEDGQGYTDVFISAKLDGMPEDRKIRDLFMCYRPFAETILPETEEKFKKINQETAFSLRIEVAPHYKNFGTPGPGVFVQQLNNEEEIPIDQMINFLENVERVLVENVSLVFAKRKEEIEGGKNQ